MLALLVAASILSTISRNTCLVAAQPQLRSHVEFLTAFAQAPQFSDQAEEVKWDMLVKSRPDSPVLLALRTLLKERAGDLGGAVDDLVRLEQECRPNEWSRGHVADCRYRLGVQKKELEWLLAFVEIAPGKFLGSYSDEALACDRATRNTLLHLLDRHIANHPGGDAALCLRGLLHHIDGRLKLAIRDYQAALWNRPRDADLMLILASAQSRWGNDFGALVSLREAVRVAPDDGGAQRFLAAMLMKWKKYDEAIAPATRAIHLNPDPTIDYLLRGVSLAHVGERSRAIKDLTHEPPDQEWWSVMVYLRCGVLLADDDIDGALADAESLVARDPCEKSFRMRGLVHGSRGEHIFEMSDLIRAIPDSPALSQDGSVTENKASKGIDPRSMKLDFGTLELVSHTQRYESTLRYALALMIVGKRGDAKNCLNALTTFEKSGRPARLVKSCYLATQGDYANALGEFRRALAPSRVSKPDSLILTGSYSQTEAQPLPVQRTSSALSPTNGPKQHDEKKSPTEYLDRTSLTEVMTDKDGRVPALNPVPWCLERKETTKPVNRKND
jgi:tetratricopeptide (TPR) repeat protein